MKTRYVHAGQWGWCVETSAAKPRWQTAVDWSVWILYAVCMLLSQLLAKG
jgi:hypothetical protein